MTRNKKHPRRHPPQHDATRTHITHQKNHQTRIKKAAHIAAYPKCSSGILQCSPTTLQKKKSRVTFLYTILATAPLKTKQNKNALNCFTERHSSTYSYHISVPRKHHVRIRGCSFWFDPPCRSRIASRSTQGPTTRAQRTTREEDKAAEDVATAALGDDNDNDEKQKNRNASRFARNAINGNHT